MTARPIKPKLTKRERQKARAAAREKTRQKRRAAYEPGRIAAHNARVARRAA